MSIPERVNDNVALPLILAMESHQGMTKGQISECRAILHRLCAWEVVSVQRVNSDGSPMVDDRERPLMERKARVKAWRVDPDMQTRNEKRLAPLLLDHAARDFQHDPSRRKLAEHPTLIAERAAESKRHEERLAKQAETARADDALRARVDEAVAPLAAKLDQLADVVATLARSLAPLTPAPSPLAPIVTVNP